MLNTLWQTVIFGLIASASFGAADFSGGFATKRTSVYTVIIVSQAVGFGLMLILLALFWEVLPPVDEIIWGCLAGIAGVSALMVFYKGLSVRPMSVFSPVASVVSVAFPVIVSGIIEGAPSDSQKVGIALAFVAVWIISRPDGSAPIHLREINWPLLAGLLIGCFFVFLERASQSTTIWPMVIARITSLTMMTAIILAMGRSFRPPRPRIPMIALAGLLDVGGNVFFILAAQKGRLDIATVLASFAPATTVVLAWGVLNERITRRQLIGLGAILVAITLIVV